MLWDSGDLLVVSRPWADVGGGGRRAYMSIRSYWDTGLSPHLVVPDVGRSVPGFPVVGRWVARSAYGLPAYLFTKLAMNYHASPEAIVVLHENWDALRVGLLLKKKYQVPLIALLQLPPIYGDLQRHLHVYGAYVRWQRLVGGVFGSIARVYVLLRDSIVYRHVFRELKSYDLLIAVSPAVLDDAPQISRLNHCVLDPGVGFSNEDILELQKIRGEIGGSDSQSNYIVFGGRPDPGKGLLDALLAFSKFHRIHPRVKLVITGSMSDSMRRLILRAGGLLGIPPSSLVFTGFLSYSERLRVVANAKVMLYPSHVDSFSYAVIESLYLGTPVVAYSIPALAYYYGDNAGVVFVPEGDVAGLHRALEDSFVRDIIPDAPKLPTMRKVAKDELKCLRTLL